MVFFFILAKIITLYIWNISFDGNYSYTDVELMKFLNKHNIENGVLKTKIDCENIEYILRTNYDDITWVSAEIKGTQIIVHIKENFDSHIAKAEDKPYNIISNVDGKIESIITRSGSPKVKAGDDIQKGQLLISGVLEIYNDNGEIGSYRLVNSDSDIYARVYVAYNSEFDLKYKEKKYSGKKNNIIQLDILGKSIYLSGFQKKFKDYNIVKDYHQLSVTDNFFLPIGYSTIKIKEYQNIDKIYSEEQANALVSEKINLFINKLNEKGIQIIENNVTISLENEKCISTGNFLVVEKIGEIQYIDETMLPQVAKEDTEGESAS